jgi:RecA-family ATPase
MSISHRRRRAPHDGIKEQAEYLAQTEGGEVDFWLEKLMPVGSQFNDKPLLKEGFELKQTYDYDTPEGHVLYQSLRYQHRYVKTAKAFPCRHRDPDSQDWLFGRGKVAVVYRWRDLAAKPGAAVYVCEGEKDADRLKLLGLLSTTVAGQNWSEHAAEALRDRDVFILEDNDADGRDNAIASAEILQGVAKSIRIVRLPGLPPKGDVSDWIEAGHTRDELVAFAEAQPIWGVALMSLAHLDAEPVPQQEWVLQDRIPVDQTAIFSGEGGGGKSILQLMLSSAAVLGKEWLGVTPRQGPALFIDAEDGEKIIHKRLADILRHYNSSFATLSKNIHITSLVGKDAVFGALSRKSNKIEPTPLYDEIYEMVGDLKPTLIGIASSANVFGGNELDRTQVQQFVALLTRLAILAHGAVVLISHPSLTGINSDSGLSGSTQWHNAVRARFYLKGTKEEAGEPKGNRRVIEFRKNQYGPLAESVVLEWRDGLFLPVAGATADQAEREQKAEELYLTVLRKLISQNQDLGPSNKGSNYAPARIAEHPAANGFSKKDMEAAQQRLLDRNAIHIEGFGAASRNLKHIVPGPEPEVPM